MLGVLLFRWLADQQGSARLPHLAMASPNCHDRHSLGDVVLFTEQQTNTNTVMQPQPALAPYVFPSEQAGVYAIQALQSVGCVLGSCYHNGILQ